MKRFKRLLDTRPNQNWKNRRRVSNEVQCQKEPSLTNHYNIWEKIF